MSKIGSTWQKDAQACAGSWMELGTLIGAGAGSVLRYKKEPLFLTHLGNSGSFLFMRNNPVR